MLNTAFSILSGGMDSTLATYLSIKNYKRTVAIFFDWGQKSLEEEFSAVKKICENLKIQKIEKIEAPIYKWDKSCLTQGDRFSADDDFMVPERNLVFISIAASYARANGGGTIIVGFNRDDGGYDTTKIFIEQINSIFRQGTEDLKSNTDSYLCNSEIKLDAPLIGYSKTKIEKELIEIGLFDLTYTCYAANGPCGKCPACKKREGASFVSYGNKPLQ